MVHWLVSFPGCRGRGFGRAMWRWTVSEAYAARLRRLWLLSTPESVGFHVAHGLVFCGTIWESGCLVSEQPLHRSIKEQLAFRSQVLASGDVGLLQVSDRTMERVRREPPEGLPAEVMKATESAIKAAGDAYARDRLVKS